jgi:RNA polymerase sigma factor (sigma-70 family)
MLASRAALVNGCGILQLFRRGEKINGCPCSESRVSLYIGEATIPMNADDHRLIRAFLKGNTGAFGSLTKRYEERLFNTVVRLLGNAADAQDVIQETFIKAYRSLGEFKGDSQFFTWLYRIAMNAAIDLKRRQQRREIGNRAAEEDRLVQCMLETPAGKLTDSNLVSEALHGEALAFAVLLRRYQRDLDAMLAELVPNSAERTSQLRLNVGTNVRLSLQDYRGDVPFVTWLYRIAERTVREHKQ